MGVCSTQAALKQILICGLDSVGKTTLLYSKVLNWTDFNTESTFGKIVTK